MLVKDLIKETYFALNANKGRSVLTILGIVIGIGSVIAMISIGQGAQSSITESIESNGTNVLIISPGQQQSFGPVRSGQGTADSLSNDDVEAIKELDDIVAVSPEVSSRYQVTSKESNTNASVYGVESDYFVVKEIDSQVGTLISSIHVKNSSKVAVLGSTIAEDLFGEDVNPVGDSVRINNLNFKVIGVIESTGTGFNSSDDSIFVPLSVSQRYFTGNEILSSISLKVNSSELMDQVEVDITNMLLMLHGMSSEEDADFNIGSSTEMIEMASSVTGTLTILLGAIAGISLLVGGIGIMNMMLTSVTERTREIGLRKAIGAKNKEISLQFLIESATLTLIGGVVGIVLGWVISIIITKFFDMNTSVTLYSVVLSFGVSVVIGIVFGYYPARRASKLNPIDALRYE